MLEPVELLITAENTYTKVFSPRIGKFQISADGGSKISIQIQVGLIGWTTVATIAITTGGISIQEHVDVDVMWRVGIITGDFTANVRVRLAQS